jgi:type IV secretory pathway TraG/TraD family ATPase VirD4
MATDENIAWVLSGNDFDFNLIDPEHPKMFAVSNNFSKNSVYSPVIAMLLSISSRQFTMQNKVPFVYFLDEMTTVKIKNFETLPSVLREYKAAFVLLTQSGAKLENLYGKLDRSSVEANFGNMFLGRTKDVEALKYYPLFFGKEEKERRSRSAGKSGSSSNSSVTISSQKEDVYQGKDFSELEPGEFIGSATRANVKEFKAKFKMFEMEEEDLPVHEFVTPEQVTENYDRIIQEVQAILNGDI